MRTLEPFTDLLLGSPVRWFLEYKNQMRSAGSKRQARNLVLVVKWSKNHATGIPSNTGDPSYKSAKVSTLFTFYDTGPEGPELEG